MEPSPASSDVEQATRTDDEWSDEDDSDEDDDAHGMTPVADLAVDTDDEDAEDDEEKDHPTPLAGALRSVPGDAEEAIVSKGTIASDGMDDPMVVAMREAMDNNDWGSSLALLMREIRSLRSEQAQLRATVNSMKLRLEQSNRVVPGGGGAARGSVAFRKGSVAGLPLRALAAGLDADTGASGARSAAPRATLASAPRAPPPPPRRPSRPATTPAGPTSAPTGSSAADLGVPTSSVDEAAQKDTYLWTGTWNVGTEEPIGAGKWSATRDALRYFTCPGFDVYVLAVQEGISDRLYDEFAAFTNTVRLPLVAGRTYTATGAGAAAANSGTRASASSGASGAGMPQNSPGSGEGDAATGARDKSGSVTAATAGGSDRVLGRGDGSLVGQKFTGIAVFAREAVLPNVQVLRVQKLSFGKTEGSKGGVAVVLRVFGSTVACLSCHLASKKMQLRFQQYRDICKGLGSKLGNEFFHLNEQFHHIVWMGDFNYRCSGVSGEDALALIGSPEMHTRLLAGFDDMLRHREESGAWYGYEEPVMSESFAPTYKKVEGRPVTDYSKRNWPEQVYRVHYREPLYKGGRVMDRVPGWCDRILFRSLADVQHRFQPLRTTTARTRALEIVRSEFSGSRVDAEVSKVEDSLAGDQSTYSSVNDHLVCSDHSPVRCVFRLGALETPESYAPYGSTRAEDRRLPDAVATVSSPVAPPDTASGSRSAPVAVILRLDPIEVQSSENIFAPSIAKALCPAPFEVSLDAPTAARATRSKQTGGTAASLTFHLPDPSRLPNLHLLVKVALMRRDKGHCVVSLRPLTQRLGASGDATHTYFEPLVCDGVPRFDGTGQPVHVQFTATMQVRKL